MDSKNIILLPLDGSESSLKALIYAKSLAVLLNMIVRILYISDDNNFSEDNLLDKLKLEKEDLKKFIITHQKGDPAEIIIEASENATYIVMSTHGQTSDMTKIAGKTTSFVIENSKIPVLLIKPDIVPHLNNDIWMPKKILIPSSGTPGAAKALEPVANILEKTDGDIDLLHVSESKAEQPNEAGTMTTPYYTDHPQLEWPHWVNEFVRRFYPAIEEKQYKIKPYLSKGNPADEIIFHSKKNNNDLIAIAWHGELSPLRAKTLKKIMLKTICPLMLIKVSTQV